MTLPAHVDESRLAGRLDRFAVETPSWGYADTGTRFGKFLQDAAAITIDDKLADAGQVHQYTGCCPTVAVHVQWDFAPGVEPASIAATARRFGVKIGSINPNLFQDQCYRYGSLTNRDESIRRRALDHVLESIDIGRAVGSNVLSLWLADGSNYPGHADIRLRQRWLAESLGCAHDAMNDGMTMFIEYKPFEPAFYHTDIPDWGTARRLARLAGPHARVLVDTGHHLPGTNIEQIVALLIEDDMLGGFHLNDRKYADDDLTIGSIDPYQLFRIFFEIVSAERERGADLAVAFMIDQSHNVKPKIEAMIQTATTAQELFAKAMLVDFDALAAARQREDVIAAETALRDAFWCDVRPFLADYRLARSLPADPLAAFRDSGYLTQAAAQRAPRKDPDAGRYA